LSLKKWGFKGHVENQAKKTVALLFKTKNRALNGQNMATESGGPIGY
jgi:hypothetical protein